VLADQPHLGAARPAGDQGLELDPIAARLRGTFQAQRREPCGLGLVDDGVDGERDRQLEVQPVAGEPDLARDAHKSQLVCRQAHRAVGKREPSAAQSRAIAGELDVQPADFGGERHRRAPGLDRRLQLWHRRRQALPPRHAVIGDVHGQQRLGGVVPAQLQIAQARLVGERHLRDLERAGLTHAQAETPVGETGVQSRLGPGAFEEQSRPGLTGAVQLEHEVALPARRRSRPVQPDRAPLEAHAADAEIGEPELAVRHDQLAHGTVGVQGQRCARMGPETRPGAGKRRAAGAFEHDRPILQSGGEAGGLRQPDPPWRRQQVRDHGPFGCQLRQHQVQVGKRGVELAALEHEGNPGLPFDSVGEVRQPECVGGGVDPTRGGERVAKPLWPGRDLHEGEPCLALQVQVERQLALCRREERLVDSEGDQEPVLLRTQLGRERHHERADRRRQLEPSPLDRDPLRNGQQRQSSRFPGRCAVDAGQAQAVAVQLAAHDQPVDDNLRDPATHQQPWLVTYAQSRQSMLWRVADPYAAQLESIQTDLQVVEGDLVLGGQPQAGAQQQGRLPGQERGREDQQNEHSHADAEHPAPSIGPFARRTHDLVWQRSKTTICCNVNLTNKSSCP
jgi:hypothetical protein